MIDREIRQPTHIMPTNARTAIDAPPRMSILICEPERDIQLIYRSFLKDWHVEIVETGEECMDRLTRGSAPDMVIIDSHLRGTMSAIATIRAIRKAENREKRPPQHIVITSTNVSDFLNGMRHEGLTTEISPEKQLHEDRLIDFLQKPFSFVHLLSLIRSRTDKFSKIGLNDHVLGIYENTEDEIADAVDFLKRSVQNNEVAIFLVSQEYDIEALKERIRINGLHNLGELIANGSFIIMRSKDWYIPNNEVEKFKIIRQWVELVERCKKTNKNGIRAFCMMECFFDEHQGAGAVDYEYSLPRPLGLPIVAICAYRKADIDQLSEDQKRMLVVSHNHIWTSKDK